MRHVFRCEGGAAAVQEAAPGVYMVRVEDRKTRFFEALWEIPEGITYNSYVVVGEEKTILLDTVKAGFEDCFLEALRSVTEPRSIDAVVIHHSEPDHTGALPRLLEEAGDVEVYSHPVARRVVEATYGVRLGRFKPVREGLAVPLGGGEELVFTQTPWLHWPDTVMSLLRPAGVLFSGDAFGAYSIPPPTDEELDFAEYTRSMRKYMATVIGAYRGWITRALEKIKPLSPGSIAPLHGALLRRHVGDAIKLYHGWGEKRTNPAKATVVYASMYGSVEAAAREAAEELRSRGLEVHLYGFTDEERAMIADVLGDAVDSSLLVIGAATYEAAAMPLIEHVATLIASKAASGQRAVIISSYGWGPAAAKRLRSILEPAGIKVVAAVEAAGRLAREAVARAVAEAAGGHGGGAQG